MGVHDGVPQSPLQPRHGHDFPLSRTEWAAEQLRAAIFSHELAPGQALRSVELARQWSISPTPLREALNRLAAEGLVVFEPQRGARVAPISPAELNELHELRRLLEPMALERSMRRAGDEWRSRVTASFDRFAACLRQETCEFEDENSSHRAFHVALISECDSQWLVRMVCQLFDQSTRYRAYRVLRWRYRGPEMQILRDHQTVFDACMTLDIPRAVDLYVQHLDSAQLVISRMVEQMVDDSRERRSARGRITTPVEVKSLQHSQDQIATEKEAERPNG